MKTPSLLRIFIVITTICTCYAEIPWLAFNCGSHTIMGATMDQMWDNAKLMATRAIERLNEAKGRNLRSEERTAANNAKWLWGTKHTWGFSLDDDHKAALDNVINVYNNIIALMSRNGGYLFCDDSMFKYEVYDENNNRRWQVTLPGPSHTIALSGQGSRRVCGDPTLMGENLIAKIDLPDAGGNLVPRRITAIILCPENHTPGRIRAGVLPLDYATDEERPDPDKYRTASGTILHEMVHAVDPDTYEDQASRARPPNFAGVAYGYDKSWMLAQNERNVCFVNPDNYYVFAQMSLANKKTRWSAPKNPNKAT
ncbi:hypothetical protein V8F20_011801 [Naviculisporaceae sp. PSN 640]